MPGLRSLQLNVCYRTPEDILNSFYIPCLENSVVYRRATGFFTSSALAEAARGLVQFARNGGKMFLVTSPRLTEEDLRDLQAGYDAKLLTERVMMRDLRQPLETPDLVRVQNLTWMIANDLMEIKVARPVASRDNAIFHEKLGIFLDSKTDSEANVVVFSGSMNETREGLVSNYESVDVSVSWEQSEREASRVRNHLHHFEELWEGKTEGLEVVDFPDAVRRKMIELFKPPEMPLLEPGKQRALRPFQGQAIAAWEASNRMGILAMATGSGKTFTALKCVETHSESIVVIVVPQKDLISQWAAEIQQVFPDADIRKVDSDEKEWPERVARMIDYHLGLTVSAKRLFIVSTIQSGCKQKFLDIISKIPRDRLSVIVDEVHHSGATEYSRIFELQAIMRLGLSATPYRMWDDEGNQRIFEYFGGEVFEYSISRAISEGVLSPYRYYIHPIELTTNEREEFRTLSKGIARQLHIIWSQYPTLKGLAAPAVIQSLFPINPTKAGELRALYLKRIALVKSAQAKTLALREIVRNNSNLKRCLVYCNDLTHVKEVCSILFDEGLESLQYTSEIDTGSRENLRKWIAEDTSETRFLVAVRCLDEGVDIPACDSAILISSSRSKREFVQRRGRVLRRHPSKDVALIHDIVVLPFVKPEDAYALSDSELEFARAELERVDEFANSSENKSEIDVSSLLRIYESAMVAA